MPNTIPINDWLEAMDREYLSWFVRDGGASVKFAVTPEESREALSDGMRARCEEQGYLFVELNAARMRAHMPQDIFFDLAGQVDWRSAARRMILRLAAGKHYGVGGIDPDSGDNVFDAIANAHNVEAQFIFRAIMPEIEQAVTKNSKMAKDFRVAMSHLCLNEDTRSAGEYAGRPLLEWLTSSNTRVGSVRPFSIYTPINRTTARYFIESALYWIRFVGYAGTVILFDNSRVTLARNPKDGSRYYTKAMAMDHYELLREFVDSVERLSGTLLVVAPSHDFLDEDNSNRARGYGIYPALRTRVMDDVRDRNLVNPVASLVRLS